MTGLAHGKRKCLVRVFSAIRICFATTINYYQRRCSLYLSYISELPNGPSFEQVERKKIGRLFVKTILKYISELLEEVNGRLPLYRYG